MLLLASPATAMTGNYVCAFVENCPDADCVPGPDAIVADLVQTERGWQLVLEDTQIAAQQLEPASASLRHFLVSPSDVDADAASLLTIHDDGHAFLTTHGNFLGPDAFTLTGTCTQEGT